MLDTGMNINVDMEEICVTKQPIPFLMFENQLLT